MKKKGIKRALAFLLAVVFAFSTCMTAGPYTVQATEAGQTGSGEEEVGGGTTPDQGGEAFGEGGEQCIDRYWTRFERC